MPPLPACTNMDRGKLGPNQEGNCGLCRCMCMLAGVGSAKPRVMATQTSSFHPKWTQNRPKTTLFLLIFGVFALPASSNDDTARANGSCSDLELQNNRPFLNTKSSFFRGNSPLYLCIFNRQSPKSWHLDCNSLLPEEAIRAEDQLKRGDHGAQPRGQRC